MFIPLRTTAASFRTLPALFGVVIIFTICANRSASAAEPRKALKKISDRYALLIGVDEYASATRLEFCGADQLALRETLLNSGFAEDNVFIIHDRAEETRYRPSKGNIERQLDLVLKLADEYDLIVLAFSGHGVNLEGKNFWCPNDSTLDDPQTLVSQDKIYDRLKKCRAAFKLVLVDACRNDPRLSGQKSLNATEGTRKFAETIENQMPPEGLILLNSCSPGEVSREEKSLGHGVFMNFVLEGIRGQADTDGDGFVSADELRRFASSKSKTYVAKRFNDSQRPFLRGDATSDALEFGLLRVVAQKLSKSVRNSIGMEFLQIPAGRFRVGSPVTEKDRDEDENQVEVSLTHSFYLGKTEVTQGQWRVLMGTEPWKGKENVHTGDKYPAVHVDWNEARRFCQELSEREKTTYRLPTEAEWEDACRGDMTTAFSFGEDESQLEEFAWFAKNTWDVGELYAHEVERKSPNAFGLHDMHGNVWEWCEDAYEEKRPGGADPLVKLGSYRVIRGGSWDGAAWGCRSANRSRDDPSNRGSDLGFRVVWSPTGNK
jgi:formylglycine-generating enzyme required for sulfatase activity